MTNINRFDNMTEYRTKTIGVKLTETEFEVLNEICDTLQITKSKFIRNLIHQELFQ